LRVLFFAPFNERSRDNETLMLEFKRLGHEVLFLTTSNGDQIIEQLESLGIACFKLGIPLNGKSDIFKRVIGFVRFVREHKIELVFSHLEPANLIAVLAQYFLRVRIVIVRHHVDELHLSGASKAWSYKFTYRFAKEIIAVSERSKAFMIREEGVAAHKITVIRLAYSFNLFDEPSETEVEKIKRNKEALLLLTACRMVKDKRPDVSIDVCIDLNKKNVANSLLLIGKGELETSVKARIVQEGLQAQCVCEGLKKNVMDYLEAADILVHPSLLDSSSVIIKEAGIRKKVIIACKGIGDCEEYIVNGENGFLVDKDNFALEASEIISGSLLNADVRKVIGDNLNKTITALFDVSAVIPSYQKFLQ
jgi:glycosyltransferase involved in cell wall biosynthesis